MKLAGRSLRLQQVVQEVRRMFSAPEVMGYRGAVELLRLMLKAGKLRALAIANARVDFSKSRRRSQWFGRSLAVLNEFGLGAEMAVAA
jgi:hypothetical protein